jgi:hypothetical protein
MDILDRHSHHYYIIVNLCFQQVFFAGSKIQFPNIKLFTLSCIEFDVYLYSLFHDIQFTFHELVVGL